MKKDTLFSSTAKRTSDFVFDPKVAAVFDDMVTRSVPFYNEFQYMVGELAKELFVDGSRIYDLGCATGTTLVHLHQALQGRASAYIGYDNSQAMLDQAAAKLKQVGLGDRIDLKLGDLSDDRLSLDQAGLVTMCWTLQFIRPLERAQLIERIWKGMVPGGVLLVVDKILNESPLTNRLFVKLYYDFKRRNGYSDEEIARKREALENVLIPYRIDENLKIFRQAGFRVAEPFFQWFNFVGFLCVKT